MILGSPQILGPSGLVVNGFFRIPINKQSRVSETDSRDPETEIGSLETELRVHWTRGGNGITQDAPQPGGSHKGVLRMHSFICSKSFGRLVFDDDGTAMTAAAMPPSSAATGGSKEGNDPRNFFFGGDFLNSSPCSL